MNGDAQLGDGVVAAYTAAAVMVIGWYWVFVIWLHICITLVMQ